MNRVQLSRITAAVGGLIILGQVIPGLAETPSPLEPERHPSSPQYESLFPERILPLDTRISWKHRFTGDETFNMAESLPETSPVIGKLVADRGKVSTTGEGSQVGAFDASGVVRQINPGEGKVKIEHGPIDRLGMPGMTMVFRVEDPAQLAGLEKGTEIDFDVDTTAAGFSITRIGRKGASPGGGFDTRGKVRSVSADQGKVKIEHGPIDRLGMPGMTMVFKLRNASDLERLARDMEIEFDVENGPGGFEITRLQPVSGEVSSMKSDASVAARSCFKIGPFVRQSSALEVGNRYRSRGAAIEFASRVERRYVGEMVYIDGHATREDALATAKKLREQGISDFLVLNEAGKRNALSLGVYGLRQNAELVKSRAESMNYAVKTEGRYREGRVFWLHGEQSGTRESLNLLSAEDTQAGVRYAPRACGMKEDT